MLEKDGVPANKSGVGVEAPNAAQVGQGKTQREMIFEAGSGFEVVIAGGRFDSGAHSPAPKGYSLLPTPRLN